MNGAGGLLTTIRTSPGAAVPWAAKPWAVLVAWTSPTGPSAAALSSTGRTWADLPASSSVTGHKKQDGVAGPEGQARRSR